MKILLLTDFHFKASKAEQLNQEQAVTDIIQVLHKKELKPEYIFFAGDLVFSGDKLDDFTLAKQCVLDPLLKALNLTNEQLFICPGNHDVARSSVSKSIIRNISSFTKDDELDWFYKEKDLDYKNSLLPLANYREFVATEIKYEKGANHYTDFYTAHVRIIDKQSVGIVCANTSWRAVGPGDDHNLVIPISAMREATSLIKDCEIKLLMHHHPSIDLKDYNRRSFEDVTHSKFNVSFSGHFHEEEKQIHLTNNNGIVKISGAAMYAPNDGSQRGFTYVDINSTEWVATCISYYYDLKTKIFFEGSTKQVDIPVDESKSEQNKLRKKLRDKYTEEVENANDLFLNGRSRVGAESFLQIWTPPVLSSKHSEQEDEMDATQFNINSFFKHEKVYLVLGKDKCGKTSLLTKILLDSLDEFATKDVVPILINFKGNSPVIDNADEMSRILSRYYGINRTAALNLLSHKKTLLLIDNCRIDEDRHIDTVSKLLKMYPLMNAIICADETISSRVREFQFNDRDTEKIYFRGLKSRQIRELAEKVYGAKANGQIEIVKRIKSIFSTLNIPYNFWNVSLFMYVFKDGGGNISNDVELVDLYIESILERKELIIRKASFGFEDYKIYLANLAKFLYDKEAQDYSATHREIIDFTDEYLHKNPRNNIDSKAVWEYLEERGIWRSCGSNMYTFRLSPVFEYFVSVYLKQDDTFRHQVIYDDNRYLSFANEFEMYAGANRRDENFLEAIYLRTQIVFEELHSEFQGTILDKQLQAAALEMDSLINQIDLERIREMNQEERDNLDDKIAIEQAGGFDRTSEVKVKERLPLDSTQIDSLERALQILGRVYKNANGIDTNRELVYSVFDYLIDTMCKFGFKIFQEVRDSDMVSSLEKEKAETILKLLTQFLPVLAETRMSSILGTNNFEQMIIERLKSLKIKSFDEVTHVSSNENQFKVFILCFLLADINLVKHHNRIDECISYITIGVLKHCMIMKIVHYMHFAVSELPNSQQANIKTILQDYFARAKGKFDKPSNRVISDSLQQISNRRIIIKDKNSH